MASSCTARFPGKGFMASKSDLKSFRHSIAVLKRAGLVSRELDARSVKPNARLRKLVDKYDDVLSGKAEAIKLPPSRTRKFEKLDYEVAKPRGLPQRVIVPKSAGEKITIKNGEISVSRKVGKKRITRKIVPVEYHNLEQYLDDVSEEPDEPDKWYAIRVYGGRTNVYRDKKLLIEEVSKYKSFQSAFKMRPKDQMDFYQHLEIITLSPSEAKRWEPGTERKPRKPHQQSFGTKYDKRMNRLKAGPKWRLDEYRAKAAERQRRYRRRKGK